MMAFYDFSKRSCLFLGGEGGEAGSVELGGVEAFLMLGIWWLF
jgi:hypothetical protein